MTNKYIIKPLDEASRDIIGNKAYVLYSIATAKFPIPKSISLSTIALNHYIDLDDELKRYVHTFFSALKDKNRSVAVDCSLNVRHIVDTMDLHDLDSTIHEIKEYFKGADLLMVRSSSTSEDGESDSFAGIFSTFECSDINKLSFFIKEVWKSVFSENLVEYHLNSNAHDCNIKMSVLIQEAINADFSGVCFSASPFDPNMSMIEIVQGLGSMLVDGTVIPTLFLLNRRSFKIESSTNGNQSSQRVIRNSEFVSIPCSDLVSPNNEIIKKISKLAINLEKLYHVPQDVEFCVQNGHVTILQSRNITTV